MVGITLPCVKLPEGTIRLCDRVSVIFQFCSQKALMQNSSGAALVVAEDRAHLLARPFVDDLHGNAILIIIDRFYRMNRIIYVQVLHDGKIEIHRL